MTIINFLSPLLSMGAGWLLSPLRMASLFLEGIVYELVAYAYKLFTLMTRLNFNSIEAIMGPLISRMEAIIMVLIVFKLGTELISMLLNPESSLKKGKELLINIMVTACLLVTYSWIFTVVNEVGMLFVGAPAGYDFPTLSALTGTSITEDEGIINRFVFGNDDSIEKMGDMGEYMAYQVASIFIINTTDENVLENTIVKENGSYGFLKLPNLEPEVDRKIDYTPLFGILVGGYLVFVFFSLAAEVGIRMFKLLVLQMVAPLAIITIINDGLGKNGFTGTMGNFVKTYMSIFTQLFVRIICTLAVTVFIGKFTTNLDTYFNTTVSLGDNLLTKGLLIVVVIYAGYKFVLEAPKLIDSIFKTNLSGSKGDAGFGGVIGGALLGGVTGLATGVVGGYKSGAGVGIGNKLGGALAGGITGMATGGWTGATKGNTIADKFKNMKTVNDASTKRSADWNARGGFNNVVVGAGNDIIGRTGRQDKAMNRYQAQVDAIDAYDKANTEYNDAVNKAQVDAIKGTAMDGSTLLDMRGYGDEAGTTVQRTADQIYSEGYDNVLLGDNAENYAQRIILYDKEYQAAQADLITAQNSGDKQQIADAHAKLVSTKQYSEKRAKDYWNSKKEAATISVDNSKLVEAQSAANKKLGREETASIDVKATKREITQKQKDIQDTRGYKATHPSSKK